jgi:hypothetical protein
MPVRSLWCGGDTNKVAWRKLKVQGDALKMMNFAIRAKVNDA